MTILLTGMDGYMGWPTALKLSRAFPDERIVGVDNFARRRWVEECGSESIVPISPMEARLRGAMENGFENISFIHGDLTDKSFVDNIISIHKPHTLLHLASQPSAPYSQVNGERAAFTQSNILLSNANLLWALREHGLTETHFIETTTTGIYGAPNIQIGEGFVDVVDSHGNRDTLPFPNLASSWYHIARGFGASNMQLTNMQTGLPCSDVRTSIVYGLETEETPLDDRLATRFDIDFYFGTLFNRWAAMIILGHPLTVYGSGNQIKPFISLEDTATSLANLVEKGGEGYKVYNQLVEYVRIKDMAEWMNSSAGELFGSSPGIDYIPNPRREKEESEYSFENREFLKILGRPENESMKETLPGVLEKLENYRGRLRASRDRLIPKKG